MTVAVQKGHETLKEELRNRGYDVVTYGEFGGAIDAVVYSGSLEQSPASGNFSMEISRSLTDQPRGILMINMLGKSVAEIDHILNKRVYSPLF